MVRSMQKLTAEDVKKFAIEAGADLVGIASIDRFDGAPPHLHPAKTILPTAKSVVVVAKRIPRGCFRGNLEGTNFTTYTYYGYVLQQHRYYMHKLDYEVACFIERHGWEAVPNQTSGAHFRIAAFAAGLGQIGWHQLLLTPQFGPRQRFGLIVTEAKLEPDPLFEGKLCDPEDCGYRCVAECPNGAVPKTRKITVNVAGKTLEFSDLNLERCLPNCIAITKHSPFMVKDLPGIDEVNPRWRGGMPLAFSLYAFSTNQVAIARGSPPPPTSGGIVDCYHMLYRQFALPFMVFRGSTGCMEACIEYLEEKGKIPRYQYPLRRREKWKL